MPGNYILTWVRYNILYWIIAYLSFFGQALNNTSERMWRISYFAMFLRSLVAALCRDDRFAIRLNLYRTHVKIKQFLNYSICLPSHCHWCCFWYYLYLLMFLPDWPMQLWMNWLCMTLRWLPVSDTLFSCCYCFGYTCNNQQPASTLVRTAVT